MLDPENQIDPDDLYIYIPENPILRFVDKYSGLVDTLPDYQVYNVSKICNLFLDRNPIVEKSLELQNLVINLRDKADKILEEKR